MITPDPGKLDLKPSQRLCGGCGEPYEPTVKYQRRCDTCHYERIREDPESYQCPYWYCLEWYIPGKSHTHRKITREESDTILETVPDWINPTRERAAIAYELEGLGK